MMTEQPEQVDDCPFCDRIARLDYVHEYVGVVTIPPLNPVTKGHLLFVPSTHHEHGTAAAPVQVANAMNAAAHWAYEQGIDANLITNIGRLATQSVPHIHVHFVPRRRDDGLPLPWTPQQRDSIIAPGSNRDIDDVIEFVETRTSRMSPTIRRVLANRLNVEPTADELHRASTELYGE